MVIHFQIAYVTYTTMMSSVGLNVLTFLTESHTIVDCAVKNGKIGRQMLQQSRLLFWILNLVQLVELLSRDLERRRHDGDWREDGLVVGPYQEYKEYVIEE